VWRPEPQNVPNVFDMEGLAHGPAMTKAELYRTRAVEFLALADEASDPEEREALRTFAFCCLQLSERVEKYWQQKQHMPTDLDTLVRELIGGERADEAEPAQRENDPGGPGSDRRPEYEEPTGAPTKNR
jgi:hypothetical protein